MKTITLLNEKGGVGKTTCAIHIAAARAILGDRVLIIDSDPQGHCTTRLGLKESSGLYDLIVRDAEWETVLRESSSEVWAGSYTVKGQGQLVVLPSNIETRLIPMAVDDITLLRERLKELQGHFDLVVIDTSPTPSLLQTMLYVATDLMVYPTQCQYLSLEGLGKSILHIKNLNAQRDVLGLQAADLGGVLPTMYEGRTDAHRHGMRMLEKGFGDKVLPALRALTSWREAEFEKKTIFAAAPESQAEADMWAVVDVLNRKIG